MRILIVEDDKVIGKNIENALEEVGYKATLAALSLNAERLLKEESFDCVILDVNLPGKNGWELCQFFRTFNKHTPVLFLTAYDELEDKVQGYESGADDYLTKPFYMKELILRIQSLIKRSKYEKKEIESLNRFLNLSDMEIDWEDRIVKRKGNEIVLTPREFQILKILIEAQGHVVSKRDLVKEIWGSAFEHNTNTIEVYINFLRNKIDKPFQSQWIKTRIGYGYYLDTEK